MLPSRAQRLKKSVLPPLLVSLFLSTHNVGTTKPSPIACKTIGTSLQFEVIYHLINTPQQGQGHIKVKCRNNSNKSQRFAISIYQKNKETLALKKNGSSQIKLELFSDENHKIPLSGITGGSALTLEASVAEQTESIFEVPFFAQLTFSKIPEAGEHVETAEFEVVHQPVSVDERIKITSLPPER